MALQLLLFVAGLFLLLQGAHYLIDGSVNIARRFHVSRLVIGLTVVAMGTSAPELTVNIISAVKGQSELLLSNVNGSNLINILFILGVTALVARIPVDRKLMTREFPYLVMSNVALFAMIADSQMLSAGVLYRWEGVVLLLLFVMYMIHVFREARIVNKKAGHDKPQGGLGKNIAFLTLGGIGLVIGAQFMVDSAVSIATALGVSATLIGITIVALGTSLPELAASIVAIQKKETDLALGNVIGSNIFNTLLIVGVSSIIAPQPIVAQIQNSIDVAFVVITSLLLLILLFISNARKKKFELSRGEGVVMILVLCGYLAYILIRG